MGVKPSDKEISSFRKYLKKQGFTVEGLPTVNKIFHKIHQNLTKFTSTIL